MIEYKYLVAPVLGWAVAQSIKFTLSLRKDGVRWGDALQSGGMPSSHAAFMVATCTVVGLGVGIDSVEFGIVAAVTAIILYDSLGVRRTTGNQTDAINELADNGGHVLATKIAVSKGHSLPELIVGTIVGAVVGFVVNNVII